MIDRVEVEGTKYEEAEKGQVTRIPRRREREYGGQKCDYCEAQGLKQARTNQHEAFQYRKSWCWCVHGLVPEHATEHERADGHWMP